MGARFSAPVQTGPGAYPVSCTVGTRSFLGVKRPESGVGHPPYLAPRSWKCSVIPVLTLWGSVACYREKQPNPTSWYSRGWRGGKKHSSNHTVSAKKRQEGQSTYNITLRHVRATIVAVEKQRILHNLCVCFSLRYPTCNGYTPYCHLWYARVCNIFPHYLTKGTIFAKKKKLLNTKCVSRVSVQLLSETFIILRRNERDMIENVYMSSCKIPVILVRL